MLLKRELRMSTQQNGVPSSGETSGCLIRRFHLPMSDGHGHFCFSCDLGGTCQSPIFHQYSQIFDYVILDYILGGHSRAEGGTAEPERNGLCT